MQPLEILKSLVAVLFAAGGGEQTQTAFGRICCCGGCGFDHTGSWESQHTAECDALNTQYRLAQRALAEVHLQPISWWALAASADQRRRGPYYIEDQSGAIVAEGLDQPVAAQLVAHHNRAAISPQSLADYLCVFFKQARLDDRPVALFDRAAFAVDLITHNPGRFREEDQAQDWVRLGEWLGLVTTQVSQPVRVYYNTRRPFALRMPDSPALNPADYEAVIVIHEPNLRTADAVWARLNEDERPGGQSFRSMCSGDAAEIEGVLHECLSLGWRVVDPVAANTLRQRFGLPTHSLPDDHIQNFVAAFDAWTVSPEGIAGPLFDQVLAARETVGHVQPVA
ncbi:MAG: hypothetical protein HY870_22435 [Chloroflexi bacterium]|nr:hypothetical protein [Chloroflexota bacterium]